MAKKSLLSEASKNYNNADENGIHPISKTDMDIIQLLITILEQSDEEDLRKIIKDWKTVQDEVIKDEMIALSENFFARRAKRYFIQVGDKLFNAFYLQGIESLDRYSDEKKRPVYCLLVNRSHDERVAYGNTLVEFITPEQRDEELEKIKVKLSQFVNIKFL